MIWMGDFNYRLAAPYEWAVARAEVGAFAELLGVDQLRQELGRGAIFHGMVCAEIMQIIRVITRVISRKDDLF